MRNNRKILFLGKIIVILIIFLFKSTVSAQVKFIEPSRFDTLVVGKPYLIQWTNSGKNTVSLFYSVDNGISWKLIKDNIKGNSFLWIPPELDKKNIKLKLKETIFNQPSLFWNIKPSHLGEVRSVNISKDGKFILSGGADSKVKIWDIELRDLIDSLNFKPGSNIYSTAFLDNNDKVIIAIDSSVYLWDRQNDTMTKYASYENIVRHVTANKQLKFFAGCSFDGSVKIFSSDSFTPVRTYYSKGLAQIYSCYFSDDGKLFAYCDYEGIIYIYDFMADTLISSFKAHGEGNSNKVIWSINFSYDNKLIISGGTDAKAKIWDTESSSEKISSSYHKFHIRSVGFHPSGIFAYSSGLDSLLYQWDVMTGNLVCEPIKHGGQILTAGYSLTGDTIITAGRDSSIKLWRNFYLTNSEDIVDAVLIKVIKVKFPNITASTNEQLTIPLIAENPYNLTKIPPVDFIAVLGFPNLLLELFDITAKIRTFLNFDCLTERFNRVVFPDTIAEFRGRTLFNKYGKEVIKIDSAISLDTNYLIEVENGSITVLNNCNKNNNQNLIFDNNSQGINILSINNKNLELSFYNLEDGRYVLELYNINGLKVQTLYNGEVSYSESGNNLTYVNFNVKGLAQGSYFIILLTPSGLVSKQILIMN